MIDKLSVEEIMEEMHGLRPEYKQVLILKYIHDLNSNEITEIVGVPAPTIRQWIFRTKEAIKKSLKKKSGDLYETR